MEEEQQPGDVPMRFSLVLGLEQRSFLSDSESVNITPRANEDSKDEESVGASFQPDLQADLQPAEDVNTSLSLEIKYEPSAPSKSSQKFTTTPPSEAVNFFADWETEIDQGFFNPQQNGGEVATEKQSEKKANRKGDFIEEEKQETDYWGKPDPEEKVESSGDSDSEEPADDPQDAFPNLEIVSEAVEYNSGNDVSEPQQATEMERVNPSYKAKSRSPMDSTPDLFSFKPQLPLAPPPKAELKTVVELQPPAVSIKPREQNAVPALEGARSEASLPRFPQNVDSIEEPPVARSIRRPDAQSSEPMADKSLKPPRVQSGKSPGLRVTFGAPVDADDEQVIIIPSYEEGAGEKKEVPRLSLGMQSSEGEFEPLKAPRGPRPNQEPKEDLSIKPALKGRREAVPKPSPDPQEDVSIKPALREKSEARPKPNPEPQEDVSIKPALREKSEARPKPNPEPQEDVSIKPALREKSQARPKPNPEPQEHVSIKPAMREKSEARPKPNPEPQEHVSFKPALRAWREGGSNREEKPLILQPEKPPAPQEQMPLASAPVLLPKDSRVIVEAQPEEIQRQPSEEENLLSEDYLSANRGKDRPSQLTDSPRNTKDGPQGQTYIQCFRAVTSSDLSQFQPAPVARTGCWQKLAACCNSPPTFERPDTKAGWDTLMALENRPMDPGRQEDLSIMYSVWRRVLPEEPFALNSPGWRTIGFSNSQPLHENVIGTLGFLQLLYALSNAPKTTKDVLEISRMKDLTFPFATTSFNITALALKVVKSGVMHRDFDRLHNVPDVFNYLYFGVFLGWIQKHVQTPGRAPLQNLEKIIKSNAMAFVHHGQRAEREDGRR